jgi:NAD-dependent dihydropyrimidine dehydrogenase PreA subunit
LGWFNIGIVRDADELFLNRKEVPKGKHQNKSVKVKNLFNNKSGGKVMPSYVIVEKCDGCKGQDRTACMYICPNDLMVLDKDGSAGYGEMKAYNRDPQMCWE